MTAPRLWKAWAFFTSLSKKLEHHSSSWWEVEAIINGVVPLIFSLQFQDPLLSCCLSKIEWWCVGLKRGLGASDKREKERSRSLNFPHSNALVASSLKGGRWRDNLKTLRELRKEGDSLLNCRWVSEWVRETQRIAAFFQHESHKHSFTDALTHTLCPGNYLIIIIIKGKRTRMKQGLVSLTHHHHHDHCSSLSFLVPVQIWIEGGLETCVSVCVSPS